jgi:hypothetical protein
MTTTAGYTAALHGQTHYPTSAAMRAARGIHWSLHPAHEFLTASG